MTTFRQYESLSRGSAPRDKPENIEHQYELLKKGDDLGGQFRVIFLIDERQLNLESLASWLRTRFQELEICAFGNVNQASEYSITQGITEPVFLCNIGSSSILDPVIADRIRTISTRVPNALTVLVSDHGNIEHVVAALRLGVKGYVPSTTATSVLVGALRLVCAGGTYIPIDALKSFQQQSTRPMPPQPDSDLHGLTPRQMEVLCCLRKGMANKIIAYELNMRESTVKVHIRRIMEKLNATNRTQVVWMTNAFFEKRDACHDTRRRG